MKLIDSTFNKIVKPEDIRLRLLIFTIVTLAVFGALISRLWFLQVMGGQQYMERAESNYIRTVSLDAPRGLVYDRTKKVIVNNRPSIGVALSPSEVEKHPKILKQLSKILKMSVEEIEEKLKEKKTDPLKSRVIKRDIDDVTLAYIEEHKMNLPGVEVISESIRTYPYSSLGAHVFGYLGEISETEMEKLKDAGTYVPGDIIGKTGIESVYEGILKGQKGTQYIEVNASAKPIKVVKNEDPIPGHNLMLTINLTIQQATEKALTEAIEQAHRTSEQGSKANGAAAVVLDPRNGEVLAMASYPTYNPEMFVGGISKKDWQTLIDKKNNYPLNNRALMAYPPGSTFKPVPLMGGFEDGLIKFNDTFECTGRWYGLGKKWARYCWDHSGHGSVGMSRGIAESCDTVFYMIGHRFYKQTKERLQYWARACGLGARTEIDLPMEARGRIPDKKWKQEFNENNPEFQKWYPGDTVNIAIGQGDLLSTPLQIATLYGAIANGGISYRPHLGKAMISWDGNVQREFKLKSSDKSKLPVSPNVIEFTQDALAKVVQPGGTAA
ncbi:MAG: penicillin-binding protein 2, partial [Rubrobacteridae bacterium]|nr:penicillin-binding protein 2 [Rubrobacteridae bacterium]